LLNLLVATDTALRASDHEGAKGEMDVVKLLALRCPQYPVECVTCLRRMIEGGCDPASTKPSIWLSDDHVVALLTRAKESIRFAGPGGCCG